MHLILSLLAAVALLAFGVNLTKTSVLRLFASSISRVFSHSLISPPRAFLSGVAATMLLQSSTAASLLVSSFLKKNLLSLSTALTIMLGADLGTALTARILTFDLSLLCPFLLSLGAFFYLSSSQRPRLKHSGGIVLGLGLILLALQMIVQAASPALHSEITSVLLNSLAGEIAFSLILGAALSILCFSSLAAVLLTSLIAATGTIDQGCAVSVVIGANLGSCVLEILGALKQGLDARRVMLGNTAFKMIIACLCLACMPFLAKLQQHTLPAGDFVIWFHVGFNLMVCVTMLPCVRTAERLLYLALPKLSQPQSPDEPRHLDVSAYMDPELALINSTRELLRLGDFTAKMFVNVRCVLNAKALNGESSKTLRERVRYLAQRISGYLAAIPCDSSAQRHRLSLCLLCTARLSEFSSIVFNIQKRSEQLSAAVSGERLAQSRSLALQLSDKCELAFEHALHCFAFGSQDHMQQFEQLRAQFSALIDSAAKAQFEEGKDESEAQLKITMLELIGLFRQTLVIFESAKNGFAEE